MSTPTSDERCHFTHLFYGRCKLTKGHEADHEVERTLTLGTKAMPTSNKRPQGPLWTPTREVERMMRNVQANEDETMVVNRKVLEGLLYDSLLWRQERAAQKPRIPSRDEDKPVGRFDPKVMSICTAYESGFGHGVQKRATANPYQPLTQQFAAWEYGHWSGTKKRAHETSEPFRSRITIERVKELRLKHGAGPVRTIPGEGNFAFCCCCGARTKQVREFFGYNLCGKCDEASKPHELKAGVCSCPSGRPDTALGRHNACAVHGLDAQKDEPRSLSEQLEDFFEDTK
jgi:hypothetical protein